MGEWSCFWKREFEQITQLVIKYGIKSIESHFFNTLNTKFIVTGAYSIRFAMYMGFKEIYLMGIDCKYVEIINEAKIHAIFEKTAKNPVNP